MSLPMSTLSTDSASDAMTLLKQACDVDHRVFAQMGDGDSDYLIDGEWIGRTPWNRSPPQSSLSLLLHWPADHHHPQCRCDAASLEPWAHCCHATTWCPWVWSRLFLPAHRSQLTPLTGAWLSSSGLALLGSAARRRVSVTLRICDGITR